MSEKPRRTRRKSYRKLLVEIGKALSGLPTLLPRAPAFMGKQERELNDKIVTPYYEAIAKARGILIFSADIKPKEMDVRG